MGIVGYSTFGTHTALILMLLFFFFFLNLSFSPKLCGSTTISLCYVTVIVLYICP